MSLADAIDLTGAKLVARQTLDALSETNKEAANQQIEKTMKSKMNRHETYEGLNCAHLTKSVVLPSAMVHTLKPTMIQLMGTEFALKVKHKFVVAFLNEN